MLAQARSLVECEIKKVCLVKRAVKKVEPTSTAKFDDKMFGVLRNIIIKNLQTDKENGNVSSVESSLVPCVQPNL